MSTFTELVKKRRQSGGSVTGSLSYGLKERMKEKFDPRRIFKRDGLMTALFPSLKSYSSGAVRSADKISPKLSSPEISATEPILNSIRENSKISAKNSMVLPAIHRDINVMRQNIIKLVKLKGGVATNKADMWFMKSSAAEAAYENKRMSGKVTKPEKNDGDKPTPEKEEGDTFLGFLSKGKQMISDFISGWVDKIKSMGLGIAAAVGAGLLSISTALATALASIAAAYAVNKLLPKDVSSEDPVSIMHNSDASGNLTPEAENAFVLDKPFAEKPKSEQALIGRKKQSIEEYLQYNMDNFKGPVLSEKQAYDLSQFWDIDPDPKLIRRRGEKATKHGAPDTPKVQTKSFSEFGDFISNTFLDKSSRITSVEPKVDSSSPNPRALIQSLSGNSPEKVTPKDPTAYRKDVTNVTKLSTGDANKKIDEYVRNALTTGKTIDGLPGSRKMTGDELRKEAIQWYKYDKDLGSKLNVANENVKESHRAAMKPQVNIEKKTSSKNIPSTHTNTSLETASVYDTEFLKLLGMNYGNVN